MASGPHTFISGNVFTAQRWQGDRMMLMAVHGDGFTPERKLEMAREVQCTVGFLHDALPGQPRRYDIYKIDGEVPFDGGALIGAAHNIFTHLERQPANAEEDLRMETKLLTKAGEVIIGFNHSRHVAFVEFPHKYQIIDSPTPTSRILNLQPHLQSFAGFAELPDFLPTVSIIDGMTFPLIDLSRETEMLHALRGTTVPFMCFEERPQSTAIFFAVLTSDESDGLHYHHVKIRGIHSSGIEEIASATGACTMAAHLALQFGGVSAHHVFAIEQSRNSQLCAEVKLGPDGKEIVSVTLSGRTSFLFRGEYLGLY